ncbi:hypothetical protein BpHYR1_021379 [Brachionus plicatilis]|uniref:Uncharacterized protein n=1 Tax=Brachionus plicatilis TaxID=10195 RepID=A0A3M7R6T6_BRAPC|nr:hypothetical protein BpHYR1_021379 [Brachionus plicatilis]
MALIYFLYQNFTLPYSINFSENKIKILTNNNTFACTGRGPWEVQNGLKPSFQPACDYKNV